MDSSKSSSDSVNFTPPPAPSLDAPSASSGLGLGLARRQVPVSPYLNFDPRVVSPANDSPWIFPDGTTSKPQRGLFEMAFCQIGGSVLIGASIGGSLGLNNGLKAVREIQQPTAWAIRRSTLLNHVTKNGTNTANTFGTIAVVFSAIGVILNWGLQLDEKSSTMLSATSTGLLYGALSDPEKGSAASNSFFKKAGSTVGQMRLKRSIAGGVIGVAASLLYVLSTKESK